MPRNVSELKSGGGGQFLCCPSTLKSGGGGETRPPVPHRSTPVQTTQILRKVTGDIRKVNITRRDVPDLVMHYNVSCHQLVGNTIHAISDFTLRLYLPNDHCENGIKRR